MKKVDPSISKIFKEMAKKRKNPYHHFSDRSLASEAGRKGAQARWHEKSKENENQDDIPTQTWGR